MTLTADQRRVLEAVRRVEVENETRGRRRLGREVLAADVAAELGVAPGRRLGNGAVKGSWSGRMAPALRVAPTLGALYRRGLLSRTLGERSRASYVTTAAGRRELERGA